MDIKEKQSRYFLLVIILIFLSIVIVGFYNIFIKDNYEVLKLVDCDPETDSCFIPNCENEDSCDEIIPYKKIAVSSNYAGPDFDSLTCLSNSDVCKIITCQIDTLEVGEKCSK